MPEKKRPLYKLTEADKRIFALAEQYNDPSIITNYYLRTEYSGTYWRPVLQEDYDELVIPQARVAADKWATGYEFMYKTWVGLGRPQFFAPKEDRPDRMAVLSEVDFKDLREQLRECYQVLEEKGRPVFFFPHGTRLLPWHLGMHRNESGIQVVIGGYGSGKTLGKLILMLVRAITLRGYAGLGLGPWAIQAGEIYDLINLLISGTIFEDRFVRRAASKPNPIIEFGHDGIGRTKISCYPVLENTQKLLSVTADEAIVDQVEQFENIDEAIRHIGSRFRGLVQGRPRIGQMTLVANSTDHPTLWDIYDEGQTDNRHVWSLSPMTFDNIYLTMADLVRYQRQVGSSAESIRVHMMGGRPIGGGEIFPASSLALCKDDSYDQLLSDKISQGARGYESRIAQRVDTYYFSTPYKEGELYAVVADPGWGNPPERNSPAVSVWQITGFPNVPAKMVAFHWLFAEGSPLPWLNQYKEWVNTYHALGFNAFDATGFQAGYEKMTDISNVLPMPVILNASTKYRYLNLYKRWMSEGKFNVPSMISHWYSQHAKYKLPDEKLRQDLVSMMLAMSALLEPLSYNTKAESYTPDYDYTFDRHAPVYDGGMYEDRYENYMV